MSGILQHLNAFLQQINAWFPGIPSSTLLFLDIVAGFLVFAIVLLILRILWAIILAVFGVKRRRRRRHADPAWERQVRLKELRQQHRQRWRE